MKELYPWQHQQWGQLLSQFRQQRLPHALLLSGAAGLGKLAFAEQLAWFLLCKTAADRGRTEQLTTACGQCAGCRLLLANNHPDLLMVMPEEAGKNIKIDQIRELTFKLQQTAQRAGYQVVIIAPVEALNKAAANALLKTLEEPAGQALLLLVSHSPGVLPATIISRCQKIYFTAAYQAKAWLMEQPAMLNQSHHAELLLNFAEQAPLKALNLAQNNYLTLREQLLEHLQQLSSRQGGLLPSTAEYVQQDLILWIDVFISLVVDVARLGCGVKAQSLTNHDKLLPLQQLAAAYSLSKWLSLLTDLSQARQWLLSSQMHLNEQLLLESLFCKLTGEF